MSQLFAQIRETELDTEPERDETKDDHDDVSLPEYKPYHSNPGDDECHPVSGGGQDKVDKENCRREKHNKVCFQVAYNLLLFLFLFLYDRTNIWRVASNHTGNRVGQYLSGL